MRVVNLCVLGHPTGLFQSELRRHVAAAKAAVKPRLPEQIKAIENQILTSSEMLEHSANLAMGAMLLGPVFGSDAKDPRGRVFDWVSRMLRSTAAVGSDRHWTLSWAPKKYEIAKEALKYLLSSNLDMMSTYLDQSYSSDEKVANAFFLVFSDFYVSHAKVKIDSWKIISLILHKVIDSNAEVRSSARKMLTVMEARAELDAHPSKNGKVEEYGEKVQGLMVVGSLKNSHLAYQRYISGRLASRFTELSLPVTLEILSRHTGDRTMNQALLALPPWLECASFVTGSDWGIQVLEALYKVSRKSGAVQSHPIENIWTMVASNRRNIIPVLDFLISKLASETRNQNEIDSQSGSKTSDVAKQIALYISRVAPRYTIDHLVHQAESNMIMQKRDENVEERLESSSAVELGLVRIKLVLFVRIFKC